MNINGLVQLKPEEDVLLITHQSIIPWIPRVVLAFIWLVLPFFLLFPLFHLGLIGATFFLVLLFSGVLYAIRLTLMWRNSVFIITDRRIIDVDQRGMFSRVVSEAVYAVIADVSYSVRGVLPTVFRFGNVMIQTHGSAVNLEVYRVHRPNMVHDLVNDLRHEVNGVVEPKLHRQTEEERTEERDRALETWLEDTDDESNSILVRRRI